MYVIYYKLLFELYMLKFDQFLTFVTCHVQHKRPVPTLSQTCYSFGTHFIPGLSQKAADAKSGTRLRILLWRPWVEARFTVTASKPVTNLLRRSWNVTNRVWRGWDAHVTSLGAVTVLACNKAPNWLIIKNKNMVNQWDSCTFKKLRIKS